MSTICLRRAKTDCAIPISGSINGSSVLSCSMIYSEPDKDSGFAIRNRGFSRFLWAMSPTG